jgi:hypothetical protein
MIGAVDVSASNARPMWRAFTIAVAALAIGKGLRLPNLWSATQLQLGYQMGFVKRAGAGALLQLLHVPVQHYWVFAGFSFLVLIAAIALFCGFARQNATSKEAVAFTPIFASSFAVTYFTHLVGYLDLILLALALLLLVLPRTPWRTVLDYCFCLGALLVHENFLLTFFPVIWLHRLLPTLSSGRTACWGALARSMALPIAACLATLIIAVPRPLAPERVLIWEQSLQAVADFPLRADFFDLLHRSLADNVHIMFGRFRTVRWWVQELSATLSLLWVAAFFTWRALRIVGAAPVETKALLRCATVVVCLAPVLLQLAAWDLYRWYATAAFTSFMTYLLLVRRFPDIQSRDSARYDTTIAMALVGLNLCTGTGLLDDYKINTFPFVDEVYSLAIEIKHTGHIPMPAE